MTEIILDSLAVGGNRHPAAADWDTSGLLAFGADDNVALWSPNDPNAKGVRALLKGHVGSVNAVKFIRSSNDKTLLLSGATDKTIRVWQQDDQRDAKWREAAVLEGHENAINAFAVLNGSSHFASASADAHVNMWQISQDGANVEVSLQQKIVLSPHYFPLALAIASLEASKSIVLAVAGTSPTIQVYVSPAGKLEFSLAATLTGHEGWIRSLAFVREPKTSDLLLASASQDKYVRIWRLHQGEQLAEISHAAKDPLSGSISKTLSNKPHRFRAREETCSITFEALLVGHEDWIYTARWDDSEDHLRLLTASADNSLSVWELDQSSDIWICSTRLGEISAQKGATTATGSSGGFWIGLWGPAKDVVVSLGRTGAWRLWRYQEEDDTWTQSVAITGHTREVSSVTWSTDGSYLLSTSADQTTRLFAKWQRGGSVSWHEMSRPQIHGYDLNCISSLGESRMVSGADEKLLRVFDEPKGVADLLSSISGVRRSCRQDLPETAQIPVMGLSNKAADESSAETAMGSKVDNEALPPGSETELSVRPANEDQLGRHLLWPEKEKLYGHGYEICAVASSHDGLRIATACRASSVDHAVIRLYETESWQEVKPPLKAHSLTVTSLAFSPDDAYLLSVGRDRQCCVWSQILGDENGYGLWVSDPKAHSRMILDCAWTPSRTSSSFITAGRDKRVVVWTVGEHSLRRIEELKFDHPVTAVACLHEAIEGAFVCAVGLEDGSVHLVRLLEDSLEVEQKPRALSTSFVPSKTVTSLAWRPRVSYIQRSGESDASRERPQLAVASEDTSLRILTLSPLLSRT